MQEWFPICSCAAVQKCQARCDPGSWGPHRGCCYHQHTRVIKQIIVNRSKWLQESLLWKKKWFCTERKASQLWKPKEEFAQQTRGRAGGCRWVFPSRVPWFHRLLCTLHLYTCSEWFWHVAGAHQHKLRQSTRSIELRDCGIFSLVPLF